MSETPTREHARYAVELDAEVVTEELRVPGRTRNISRGGFCLLVDQKIEIGTECRARLSLVFPDKQLSEPIELQAMIVWCTPLAGRHQLGVKFSENPSQVRNYLDVFMRFIAEGDHEDVPGAE